MISFHTLTSRGFLTISSRVPRFHHVPQKGPTGLLREEKRIFSPNRSQGDHGADQSLVCDSNNLWAIFFLQKGLMKYQLPSTCFLSFQGKFPHVFSIHWYFIWVKISQGGIGGYRKAIRWGPRGFCVSVYLRLTSSNYR